LVWLERDRGFESCSLHRRVHCEPDSLDQGAEYFRDWISLIIRDTGPGIPLDILPRIFDPFFTTKGRKGNGFGLSQVYGFVKQVNGTISIESKDGTTITMNFRSVGRYSDVA
jgi:signal transduction histidine kinase